MGALDPYTRTLPTSFVPSWISGCALDLDPAQGIVFGGMFHTPYVAGTTPPAVTFTGVPVASVQSVRVNCDGAGARGAATFKWYVNEVLQASGVATAATVALGTTGVTANFPVGTYATDNVFTDIPSVSSWTSVDGSAKVLSQATQTQQPGWIAPGGVPTVGWLAGLGNAASLYFDGALSSLNGAFSLAQPFSVFVCTNTLSAAANGFLLSDDTQSFMGVQAGGSVACRMCSATTLVSQGQFVVTGKRLFSALLNGASSQFPYAHYPCTQGTAAFGPHIGLGWYAAGGSSLWNGIMGRVVMYNRALSNFELAQIQNFLATLNGLA